MCGYVFHVHTYSTYVIVHTCMYCMVYTLQCTLLCISLMHMCVSTYCGLLGSKQYICTDSLPDKLVHFFDSAGMNHWN